MNCQCGATITSNFCPYCGADHRTDFQRNADHAMQIGGKVMGQAKVMAKKVFIVWAIITVIIIVAFVIFGIIMFDKMPKMDIALVKVVATIKHFGINFPHV